MKQELRASAAKITSWSWTRYNDYETCPKMAYYKHVAKIKTKGGPTSPALLRGIEAHEHAEAYVKGWNIKGVAKGRLPPALENFREDFEGLRKRYKKDSKLLPMIVEDNWGFDRNWDEAYWKDWDNCWLRVKIDQAWFQDEHTFIIEDNKTGKPRDDKQEEYVLQLELYAVSALARYPREGMTVLPRLRYLDTGELYEGVEGSPPMSFETADLPRLKKLWEKRTKKMFADTRFVENPGRQCQWCDFSKKKDGPCKF